MSLVHSRKPLIQPDARILLPTNCAPAGTGGSYAEHQSRAPHSLGRAQTRATAESHRPATSSPVGVADRTRLAAAHRPLTGQIRTCARVRGRLDRRVRLGVHRRGSGSCRAARDPQARRGNIRRAAVRRSQFVPHLLEIALLMPRAVATEAHEPFLAVDESMMYNTLISGEHRLSSLRVREITATVAERSTWYEWISSDDAPAAESVTSDGLFAAGDLRSDTRGNALARPFREWMTFLDPDQLALVHTNFTGPARFSGPAGTGKSVVALHRMAHFAKRNPGRFLFTSFVKTLPTYHLSGFAQLAPHSTDRAQFTGLHAWTMAFLNRRGVAYNLDYAARQDCLTRAWQAAREVLGNIDGTDYAYWTDEIDRVIKGRGIRDLNAYKEIDRTGRERIGLHGNRREYVWKNWYLPYQQRMETRAVHDFNDVVAPRSRRTATAPARRQRGLRAGGRRRGAGFHPDGTASGAPDPGRRTRRPTAAGRRWTAAGLRGRLATLRRRHPRSRTRSSPAHQLPQSRSDPAVHQTHRSGQYRR